MLSATIVLVWLFDIKIPTKIAYAVFEADQVSPLKFWAVLASILAYTFFRFWYDEQADKIRKATTKQYYDLRTAGMKSLLRKRVEAYLAHGTIPRSFSGYEQVAADFLAHADAPDSFDHIHIAFTSPHPWLGKSGAVNLELTRSKGGIQVFTARSGEAPRYSFSSIEMIYVSTIAVLRTAATTKSTVDFLVPVYLAVTAAIICVYKLSAVIFS